MIYCVSLGILHVQKAYVIMIISDIKKNHQILVTERRYNLDNNSVLNILSTCWREIVTTQLCQYPLPVYISYLNILSLTL